MLKNDIRYILKRVIAAILIAMIIFFLKSNNVLALSFDMIPKDEVFIFNSGKYTTGSTTVGNPNKVVEITFDTSYTNSNNYDYLVIPFNGAVESNEQVVSSSSHIAYSFGQIFLRIVLVSDGNWSTCELQNNFFVCPLMDGLTYSKIRFYITSPSGTITYSFTVNNAAALYDSIYTGQSAALDSIAQSQQQMVQDQMDNSNVTTSDVDVSQMSGVQGILPAGPVDSLLSLPLTLINLLISGTSGSCTPFTFTFVFDETFTLPCFDTFWNQVPSSMLLFLSDLPAVYIFIKWAKSIYSRVERAVSFESSVDDEWGGV